MLTNDDLSAIKGLIDDAIRQHARGLRTEMVEQTQTLRGEVVGLGIELRADIGVLRSDGHSMEERLTDTIENVETGLTAKIGGVQEAVEILQEVVVKHHDKLEERVTKLENEVRASGI